MFSRKLNTGAISTELAKYDVVTFTPAEQAIYAALALTPSFVNSLVSVYNVRCITLLTFPCLRA
jgi:hypothetical protein